MLDLWDKTETDNLIIRFDMQPHGGETAPEHYAIGPNTEYKSGKFGWDTRAPYEAFRDSRRKSVLAQDGVWHQRDAAFKLDLPNGNYRVTNTFCAAEDRTHTVSLLANGEQILKEQTVDGDNKALEHTYTIEVTDGYLIQVIFTPKDRVRLEADWEIKNHFWIWNGCTVEQIQP
jgi:hypothetical protein